MKKVHACTEVRVGVMTRTFCGLLVRQQSDRRGWTTASWLPVKVSRDPREITCGSCQRGMH